MDTLRERVRPWYLRKVFFPLFPDRKPPSFDAAWTFPHRPLASAASLIGPTIPNTLDFLFLPMTDWHARVQRPQFLAMALASLGHRCFLLNPHLGREFQTLRDPSPRLARLAANIFELHVRLPAEPVFHHRLLTGEESAVLAAAIDLLRSVAGVRRFVQIVGFPVWRDLAEQERRHSGSHLIYDCHDLLSGFTGVAASISALESPLARQADLVVCSAERLVRHCIRTGVDPDRCLLIRNAAPALPAPENSAVRSSRSAPVIGYVGALEDWFDVESVSTAARALPEFRFVLAGRVESPRLKALRGIANIEFRGELGRTEVPEFLAGLDAGLIPFLSNDLTLAADPIKLYEYLAAGLPVISAPLPEISRFKDHVHFYDGPRDMARAIRSGLESRSAEDREKRIRAVKTETWDDRARTLLQYLASRPARQHRD